MWIFGEIEFGMLLNEGFGRLKMDGLFFSETDIAAHEEDELDAGDARMTTDLLFT